MPFSSHFVDQFLRSICWIQTGWICSAHRKFLRNEKLFAGNELNFTECDAGHGLGGSFHFIDMPPPAKKGIEVGQLEYMQIIVRLQFRVNAEAGSEVFQVGNSNQYAGRAMKPVPE